jgi:hypothetical protein
VLIECGANLPDGWQCGISAGGTHQSQEKSQLFAERLLNNKLQMRASSATGKVVTLTKQMKIGPCEQVKVNWKTAWSRRSAPDRFVPITFPVNANSQLAVNDRRNWISHFVGA